MKVLLTGSNGQLGRCFQDRLPEEWELWATDSDVLDITDLAAVKAAVEEFKPNVIINAAAYTAVDKAETDYKIAELINKTGPENLALAASGTGARLVHVSTDYVFDGRATTPYTETDITNPLGVYGQTKLDGENAVFSVQPDAIIIRTAWVFSEYGNNFVKTMLRLAKEKDSLTIVSDQYGCPTYAGDIANAIITLLQKKSEGGLYHFCGDKDITWSRFASSIFIVANEFGLLSTVPAIEEILTEQYKTLAIRPKFSILNCNKIKNQGVLQVSWMDSLKLVMSKL